MSKTVSGWALIALSCFLFGIVAGWKKGKSEFEGPRIAAMDRKIQELEASNTVTITNVVTKYALEIMIIEVDGKRQWTNRTLVRYKGVDDSKPFAADGILTIGHE